MTSHDVDALVAGQRFGRFNARLMLWSFLALVTDGYEITVLPFAAPYLAQQWHLSGTTIGQLISIGLVGMLAGAALFGYLGDRFGRRAAIIVPVVCYGVGALAIAFCTGPEPVYLLRFLTGLGIGGVLPNIVTLNLEASPPRLAARVATLVGIGVTLGSLLPGLAAATLVPAHGWRILFAIGGVIALAAAVALVFALPESLKLMVARGKSGPRAVALARAMRPDLAIADDVRFTHQAPHGGRVPLGRLFRGGLAPLTLLIWLAFAMGLLANYALTSWMPMLFARAGTSPAQAAAISSMFQLGGVAGTVAMSLFVGRFGFVAVAAAAVLACPAIALLGLPGLDAGALAALVAVAGFCVLGIQAANNAVAGLVYPTAVRSAGLGLALGVGRIGSLAGPLVGGMLLDLDWPPARLFLICAAPMAALAAAALLLAALARRLDRAGAQARRE